ncbi:hypothetical protein [Thiofilum flexile]|uniref:hypothetical protein n=1 Tax=Thiofilum flexile TaxID=125627 RepID=UPI001B7FD94B|nr:hypothetical protein [Thiofilum flexile]
MWFKKLTGFHEENPAQVRENLSVEGLILKSHVNDKQYQCGQLEIPSLAELRQRISRKQAISGKLVVNEVINSPCPTITY